jgi:hypothetical protein
VASIGPLGARSGGRWTVPRLSQKREP